LKIKESWRWNKKQIRKGEWNQIPIRTQGWFDDKKYIKNWKSRWSMAI